MINLTLCIDITVSPSSPCPWCPLFTRLPRAGQEDYDRLRPLSYPATHVFIVCYAMNMWVPGLGICAVMIARVELDWRTYPSVGGFLAPRATLTFLCASLSHPLPL